MKLAAPGVRNLSMATPLRPGQFFGEVASRWRGTGLILTELCHATRRCLPGHGHEHAYFCLLLAGSYAEHVGRRSLAQRPMSVVFHPPGLDHRDEVGARGGHLFCLELDTGWIERLRQEAGGTDLDWRVLPGGEPLWLATRLYRELRSGDDCSGMAVEGLTLELLAAAARSRQVSERRPPAWLGRVEALLHDGFRGSLSLDQLAAEAGVHPAHLSRTFRRFHRRTPADLIQELRVQHVCQGLTDADRPLSDLALEAGFADQSHCTRVFKQLTGMTPGAFRQSLPARPTASRPSRG